MEYLHSRRIVHFDLKCDNLLCDLRDLMRPVVKIGDLGLSKKKAATFVSGNMRGTLPWMVILPILPFRPFCKTPFSPFRPFLQYPRSPLRPFCKTAFYHFAPFARPPFKIPIIHLLATPLLSKPHFT